ncbi:upstream activation factor subunit spp27 [Strongylocentrotus purpuratus]|uniref:Upstream activation factor subunit spp27 n=1 Tax=Strongylocentrotus purpuratus TaxID=7668 RepID=A0A7M7P0L3_STRPU|nr:upstream activation factor subunit spp27 [Strongylocentrotus purpuratus]|eukprot:XP_001200842.1 PREDICTED: upstream activation factor subunit spp27 [Strongylocentrotus purpuratus]
MAPPTEDDLRREISTILQGADLSTLSSKKVRLKLQGIFTVDLADRKKQIDQILMALIAESHSAAAAAKEKEETKEVAQTSAEHVSEKGDAHRSDSSSDELRDGSPPVKRKKKKKKESSKPAAKPKEKKEKTSRKKETKTAKKREAPKSQANVEDSDDELTINDEELAWKLHQEESRRTRNPTRKAAAVKSKSTSKKANGASKDKGKTGYVADMILSPELANIIGAERMSRHEVVKRMWAIVKERNLMDPKNKQYHICDDELLRVFGQRRIRTFSMMKYLKGHIKDPRNLTTPV